MNFITMLWLVWLSFVAHEFEEWNITEFERRNFEGFPSTATTRSARAWIVFICTAGLIWCAAATLPGNPSFAAYLFLPALMIVLLNALQHVYWSWLFRQYAPGVITAVALLIPLNGYLIFLAVQQAYVAVWYAVVLMGGLVVGLIQTVSTGKQTPHVVHAVYQIGFTVSEKLRIGYLKENLHEPLKAGILGGIISGIVNGLLNYFLLPFPANLVNNAIGHAMGGLCCGFISGAIGVWLYRVHHQKNHVESLK